MGDMADNSFEDAEVEDEDGMEELRICPKCGWDDCFVGIRFRVKCPNCNYDSFKEE